MNKTGAVVEIVDPRPGGSGGMLVPRAVLVNGVDVGFVTSDGVSIEVGGDGKNGVVVTQVTLTLMPSRVIIRGADEEPTPAAEVAEES